MAQRISHCDEIKTAIGKRSEEHTSELQSRQYLVCRLLLEKKKKKRKRYTTKEQDTGGKTRSRDDIEHQEQAATSSDTYDSRVHIMGGVVVTGQRRSNVVQ